MVVNANASICEQVNAGQLSAVSDQVSGKETESKSSRIPAFAGMTDSALGLASDSLSLLIYWKIKGHR
jgi:hypothetical protein